MADGVNKVMLLGNLGRDPELRTLNGGNVVLRFSIACTESYLDRNKTRQERTEWVNCVIWGNRAEALARILSKGSRIYVEGSLHTSSYEGRDHKKVYKTEVNVEKVVLCGGRTNGGSGGNGGSRDDDGEQEQSSTSGGGSDDFYGQGGSDDSEFPFD